MGIWSKYDVMVTISDSQHESLRLRLVGRCQYDVVQYDVALLSYMPQLYFVCNRLICKCQCGIVKGDSSFLPNAITTKQMDKTSSISICVSTATGRVIQ